MTARLWTPECTSEADVELRYTDLYAIAARGRRSLHAYPGSDLQIHA